MAREGIPPLTEGPPPPDTLAKSWRRHLNAKAPDDGGEKHVYFSLLGVTLYRSHLGDYMRRWILRTRFGTLRLHNILRSDNRTAYHDHPFWFLSLILWGGYLESTPKVDKVYRAPSLVAHSPEDLHFLTVWRSTWTLVVTGPYVREWGFRPPSYFGNYSDLGDWVHWKDARQFWVAQ